MNKNEKPTMSSQQIMLVFLILAIPINAGALQQGDFLSPLTINAAPVSFSYQPDGQFKLIMVYPAKLSSRKIGKFSERMIEAGFCPHSIVDMKNRAWYVPVSFAEKQIAKGIEESPNPACSVTADYHQQAINSWGLEVGAVVIVVDGSGRVRHISYGVPDKDQERSITQLLKGVDVEH